MQIKSISVFVKDQSAALRFYTEVLGFKKMANIPLCDHCWFTAVLTDGIEDG